MTQTIQDLYIELNQLQIETHTIIAMNEKTLLTIQATWPQLTDIEHDKKMLETEFQKKLHHIVVSLTEMKQITRGHTDQIQRLQQSIMEKSTA